MAGLHSFRNASNPHGASDPISGREAALQHLMGGNDPIWLSTTDRQLQAIRSCFCCALHMHQPTIPAGTDGALISHLQFMFEHPQLGDNHNAEPFAHCYQRMAELIPRLIDAGCSPRIMLDYSGTLLWGVEAMGRDDISEALRFLACDPRMQRHVEWLGTFWGHAVAPSTPIPDLILQIQAWQHQFAALAGDAALQRVRGFSLPEMHLPNHPDTLFALIAALKQCGYRWLLVQEHSVETLQGRPLPRAQTLVPNRLIARDSNGTEISITALIKTQGSDTKLVGQMQPCYEALALEQQPLTGGKVPALVCQIADGENGGVMMNEFPSAFIQAHERIRGESTQAINGTEYLELLEAEGFNPEQYPPIQAVQQQRLWEAIQGPLAPASVSAAIQQLQMTESSFSMDGASWTNNLSWVEGYSNVLTPMHQLSAAFHARFDAAVQVDPTLTTSAHYRDCLLHLLLLETSCFRYWGQGTWTDYAREIHRRGVQHIETAMDSIHGVRSAAEA
ncbi:MAG: glycosyl hydrolase family 57 [Synechococcus sp.]